MAAGSVLCLSIMVQIPGKIIYLKKNNDALNIDEIKSLKNQYGIDATHYFDIKESDEK